MINYANLIKQYCIKHNISQVNFGKLVNIQGPQINKIINGKKKPNSGDLPKLEAFFNGSKTENSES